MIKISAVLITYNEESKIEETLKSVSQFADEIVIVDSYSEDKTCIIAKKYKAKIYNKKFEKGFGPQKRFAISKANFDWVFCLDADEIPNQKLINEILKLKKILKDKPNSNDVIAYSIKRKLVFIGKTLNFAGESRVKLYRFFNRNFANYNNASVHEKVEVNGKKNNLKGFLLHKSYDSLKSYFEKYNSFTEKAAFELLKKNKSKPSKFLILIRLPLTFIKIYFLKLGFLDGYYGFLWAFFSSTAPLVKYTKYLNLLEKEK